MSLTIKSSAHNLNNLKPVDASAVSSQLDRFNPVFVRELRQFMSGKLFPVIVGLVLLAALSTMTVGIHYGEPGNKLFIILYVQLVIIAMMVIPMYAFHLMRKEMQPGAVELLTLSGLSPYQIVWGKLTTALTYSVIFSFLLLPFIASTYFLYGISIIRILQSLSVLFMGSLSVTAIAVALGIFCRYKILEIPMILISTAVIFIYAQSQCWVVFGGMYSKDYSKILMILGGYHFIGLGLFFTIAVSALMHPYENRTTTLRFLIVIFLSIVVTAVCFSYRLMYRDNQQLVPLLGGWEILIFALPLCMVIAWLLLYSVTESDGLSLRVKSDLPAQKWRALLLFPLLPGGARGYVFLLMAMLLCTAVIGLVGHQHDMNKEYFLAFICLTLSFIAYMGWATFIRRQLKAGIAYNWIAQLLTLLTFIAATLVPLLVQIITGRDNKFMWVLNPFVMINGMYPTYCGAVVRCINPLWQNYIIFCGGLALVATMINLPAIKRAWQEISQLYPRRAKN